MRPEDTYRVALKAHIRNPSKKMIIWFLQPHYPYVDKRFNHISILGRRSMNRVPHSDTSIFSKLLALAKIMKVLLVKGYLRSGLPYEVCEYARQNLSEIIEAYIVNLISVLYYTKRLTEILPGRIAITSDHGEVFGEPLSKLVPIPVYGHPSGIRIPALTQVPYLIVENDISRHEASRKALRGLLHLSITQAKASEV
ncbi:MAG: hypothetical protein ACTSX9_09715 [Candidatus Njordarchaeales archaeon]